MQQKCISELPTKVNSWSKKYFYQLSWWPWEKSRSKRW